MSVTQESFLNRAEMSVRTTPRDTRQSQLKPKLPLFAAQISSDSIVLAASRAKALSARDDRPEPSPTRHKPCMKIVLLSMNFAPELTGIGKYSGELANALVERICP